MKIDYNGSLPFEMGLVEFSEKLDLTLRVEDKSVRQSALAAEWLTGIETRDQQDQDTIRSQISTILQRSFTCTFDKIPHVCGYGKTLGAAINELAEMLSGRTFAYTPNPMESSFSRQIYIPKIIVPDPFPELEAVVRGGSV